MRSRIDLRRASTVPSVILFLSSLRKLKIKIKAGLKIDKTNISLDGSVPFNAPRRYRTSS